jgi:hypothetical protein
MESLELLASLTDLAESLGMEIRLVPSSRDSPEHPGGAVVRLKGREILFLDPTAPAADQISAVARALGRHKELDDLFLPPEVRQALDAETDLL